MAGHEVALRLRHERRGEVELCVPGARRRRRHVTTAAQRHGVHHDPQRAAPAVGHDVLQLPAAPLPDDRQGGEGAAAGAAGAAHKVCVAALEWVERDDQPRLAPVRTGGGDGEQDGG